MCELAKRISVPVSMDFLSVSSYGSGTVSSGAVKIIKDLDEPLEGKNVLIVEDIIDSETHSTIWWKFYIRDSRRTFDPVHFLTNRSAVWRMFMWIIPAS